MKVPHVILDDSGRVVGRITLYEIIRGPFQSGSLGYWVSAKDNGRGLATAAVRDILRLAFDELRLHRVQAGTLLHNVRSQRVLERNGFVRFGRGTVLPQRRRQLATPRPVPGGVHLGRADSWCSGGPGAVTPVGQRQARRGVCQVCPHPGDLGHAVSQAFRRIPRQTGSAGAVLPPWGSVGLT